MTTDSNLLTLSPVTISNCMSGAQVGATVGGVFNGAALARGGSKFIVDSNSTPGQAYYIGVQSEDQMAAEYGFLPEFSNVPFSQLNSNGDETVTFFQVDIPDGTAYLPGYTNTLGLAIFPVELERVVATNDFIVQNGGDLATALSHSTAAVGSAAVDLVSHFSTNVPGSYELVFDDSGRNDITNSQPSAGPGSLNQYARQDGAGVWNLHAADDAPAFVGSISGSLFLEKHQDPSKGLVTVSVSANSWYYTYVTVPVGYTNLTVFAIDETPFATPGSYLTLAVQLDADPTLSNNIANALLNGLSLAPPGLSNSVSIGPPLEPGTYYIGIFNPDTVAHTVEIGATLGLYDPSAKTILDYDSTGIVPLLDDAVNYAYMDVTNHEVIQGISVGLRVDHPRISDLVFHLISPDGTRYLLMENRGADSTNGCGADLITTNVFKASANGRGLPTTNVYNIGKSSGTMPITYNFYTVPDEMTVYYGTTISTNTLILDFITNNPPVVGGGGGAQNTQPEITNVYFPPPGGLSNSTYLTVIMNKDTNANGANGTAWIYTIGTVTTNFVYLAFTEDTNLTVTPIKFAPPPFVPQTNFTPVLSENFDSYAAVTYVSPASFGGGWAVASGQVEITNNPPASSLPNSLQLDSGVIFTNVVTVPGRKYYFTCQQGSNLDPLNANWQPENYTFTAKDTNTAVVLAGSATPGVVFANNVLTATFDSSTLLDDLALTELPANLYYQAEQDISGLTGKRAYGTMANGHPWQLEVLDNRAGATNTAATLLGWQLEFTFANTNLIAPPLTVSNAPGGITQSNTLAAGAIAWYAVTVPTNAAFATNIIDFASLPVNLWFSTNNPQTITNAGDVELIAGSTNGSVLLGTSVITNPPALIVPGQTYYLGVQNPNDVLPITYAVEVDFDHGNDPSSGKPLLVSKVKVSAAAVHLSWFITGGAQYQVQWKTNLAAAWNTVTNPATATTNGVATFTDNGAQTAPLGPMRFYRLVRVH